MYSRDKLFLCPLECYFGVYSPSCFATRKINTKNKPFVTTETVRHSGIYIILYYFANDVKRCMASKAFEESNKTAVLYSPSNFSDTDICSIWVEFITFLKASLGNHDWYWILYLWATRVKNIWHHQIQQLCHQTASHLHLVREITSVWSFGRIKDLGYLSTTGAFSCLWWLDKHKHIQYRGPCMHYQTQKQTEKHMSLSFG